jgi:hypothetical protein
MKCIYYLAPTLSSAHRVSRDLYSAGVGEGYVHVVAKDERELGTQRLQSANYFETLDLIRAGYLGAAIGFLAGWVGIVLVRYFEPFGPDVPTTVYLALIAAATSFGAWEGGLCGIASENTKLRPFHAQIESGQLLILVYVRQHQEAALRSIMREAHPEAALAGIDEHFINPFATVRPVSHPEHG